MKKLLLKKWGIIFLFFVYGMSIAPKVEAQSDVFITLAGPISGLKDSDVTYKIIVSNSGPNDLTNAVLVKMTPSSDIQINTIVAAGGMSNNGNSIAPAIGDVNEANLTTSGILIPSLPDGGSVVFTINAKIKAEKDVRFPLSVSATYAGDTDPTNNVSDLIVVVLPPRNLVKSLYELNALSTISASPTLNPNGGTINLVYELEEGPEIPTVGSTIIIPMTYSGFKNRAGGPMGWASINEYSDPDEDLYFVLNFEPNYSQYLANLPAKNQSEFSSQNYGDHFFRNKLNNNEIDPLGIYTYSFGKVTQLPLNSQSYLRSADVYLYTNIKSLSVGTETGTYLRWGAYATPIYVLEPQAKESEIGTPYYATPVGNSYPFRYTAINTEATAPSVYGGSFFSNIMAVVTYLTPSSVLSVTWENFTVKKNNGTAVLNWSTASEINNRGFQVERSTNGESFIALAQVPSKATNGNSTTSLSYSFTDLKPEAGLNYYRIRQTDADGKISYTEIKTEIFGANPFHISMNPNPVSSVANFRVNGVTDFSKALVRIYNATGKLVREQSVSAPNTQLEFTGWPAGTYYVEFINKDVKQATKFVKIN